MNRSTLTDFFAPRSTTKNKSHGGHARLGQTRLRIEQLEDRRLLSGDNLLIATYDSTEGRSVLAYSDTTDLPVPGGALTSDLSAGAAQGLAVAPDGSYYVSSSAVINQQTQQVSQYGAVMHFSATGQYLGMLGANDMTQAPLVYPGALQFGPNGNLYVADLASGAIYQYDTSSTTQQYQQNGTIYLNSDYYGEYGLGYSSGFTPGGFTFDSSSNVIIGDLNSGVIVSYNQTTGEFTQLVAPNPTTPIAPASIVSLSNGDLLIADFNFDYSNNHHQILGYNASSGELMANPVINFADVPQSPVSTASNGTTPGLYAQPEAMLFDADGNLLVGVSPDHNLNGAVMKFSLSTDDSGNITGTYMTTVASNIGTPSGLALAPAPTDDLLLGTYDPTQGQSVLRYSQAESAVIGGVPFDSDGLIETSGVAVAPDGSFYVSTLATYDPSDGMVDGPGAVVHFSNSGQFLNQLDDTNSPVVSPGTMVFGPNGDLYVADLYDGAILQFDTSSGTPSYVGEIALPMGVTPAGLTFAATGTRNMIVSDFNTGNIYEDENGTFTMIVNGADDPNSGNDAISPLGLLPLSNGDLLIADSDLGYDPTGHHQILVYDPNATSGDVQETAGYLSTYITLTTPTGAAPTDYPPQPTSMALEPNGDLLVAMAPDQDYDGAVEEFDISGATPNQTPIATPMSQIGAPAGMAFDLPTTNMTVPSGDTAELVETSDGTIHMYDSTGMIDLVTPVDSGSVTGVTVPSGTLTIEGASALPAGASLVIGTAPVFPTTSFAAVSNSVSSSSSAASVADDSVAEDVGSPVAAPSVVALAVVAPTTSVTTAVASATVTASPLASAASTVSADADAPQTVAIMTAVSTSTSVSTRSVQNSVSQASPAAVYSGLSQSNNNDNTVTNDARLAAWDAVLSEYGSL